MAFPAGSMFLYGLPQPADLNNNDPSVADQWGCSRALLAAAAAAAAARNQNLNQNQNEHRQQGEPGERLAQQLMANGQLQVASENAGALEELRQRQLAAAAILIHRQQQLVQQGSQQEQLQQLQEQLQPDSQADEEPEDLCEPMRSRQSGARGRHNQNPFARCALEMREDEEEDEEDNQGDEGEEVDDLDLELDEAEEGEEEEGEGDDKLNLLRHLNDRQQQQQQHNNNVNHLCPIQHDQDADDVDQVGGHNRGEGAQQMAQPDDVEEQETALNLSLHESRRQNNGNQQSQQQPATHSPTGSNNIKISTNFTGQPTLAQASQSATIAQAKKQPNLHNQLQQHQQQRYLKQHPNFNIHHQQQHRHLATGPNTQLSHQLPLTSLSSSNNSSSSASSTTSSSSGWSSGPDSLVSCSPERAANASFICSSSNSNNTINGQQTLNQSSLTRPTHQQHQQHRSLFLQQHLQHNPNQHHLLHHHHLHNHHELGPVHKADSDDLDRIRNFIEQFKARRGSLGLTQKQAAQCFRAYTNDRYAFSDNFVGHFEGFQFRPQTAMTIADSLAEWLEYAESETRKGNQLSFMPGKVKETRKRKYEVIRIRDSAKRVLVDAFEKNKSPSTCELEQLSRKTNIPSRNIEIFFKNRRTSRQYHQ